ncbi:MAG: hypothetical protein P8Z36_13375, partial [Gemmatimonadota bacterium]
AVAVNVDLTEKKRAEETIANQLARIESVLPVALAAALLLAGAWWGSTRGGETPIVLDTIPLRAGPALRSDPVSTLGPGTGLIPVDRCGDWVRARTLRVREGWMETNRTGRL